MDDMNCYKCYVVVDHIRYYTTDDGLTSLVTSYQTCNTDTPQRIIIHVLLCFVLF